MSRAVAALDRAIQVHESMSLFGVAREVGRRQMHRHQGEDQVHPMEPGKRKLRSYADRQMLLPAWALRIRRLCAQTPTSTAETLFAHEQRDHRSLPISDAPPDPHSSRTLRNSLCAISLRSSSSKSGAELANELRLNFHHFHYQCKFDKRILLFHDFFFFTRFRFIYLIERKFLIYQLCIICIKV